MRYLMRFQLLRQWCTASRKDATITAIMIITAICRCTCCGDYLLCSRLRMSKIDASADSVEELEPLVARIRQRWPEVKIVLRGDGGFCREKLMAMRFQLLRH